LGAATTIQFKMGSATSSGSPGNWRNNFISGLTAGGGAQLRLEQSYVYFPTLTADHYAWQLTGLAANGTYRLTMSGTGQNGSTTNVANPVSGVLDADGDWNWTSLTANGSGEINGVYTAPSAPPGLFGLQLELIPPAIVTPEPGSLALLGL